MIKSELNTECGKRLKQCLEESSMTQIELANLSGFTQQYISNIVVGKKPMTDKAAKLFAKHLNIRREYLLCEDDFKTCEDEENARKDISCKDCYCVINYLQSLNISVVPLLVLPSPEEELENDPYFLENKYGSSIIDKSGKKHALMKAPWMINSLHKNNDVIAHKCMASLGISVVAVETPDTYCILSLDEFSLFLKNIDEFVKFSIENFFNNYECLKEYHTPKDIKDAMAKHIQDN